MAEKHRIFYYINYLHVVRLDNPINFLLKTQNCKKQQKKTVKLTME